MILNGILFLVNRPIENNSKRFKTILIFTERKAHVDILNLYLKDKFETITVHGDDSESADKVRLIKLNKAISRL